MKRKHSTDMGDVYTDILCGYGKQSHTTTDSYHVKKTTYLGFIVGENGIVDLTQEHTIFRHATAGELLRSLPYRY